MNLHYLDKIITALLVTILLVPIFSQSQVQIQDQYLIDKINQLQFCDDGKASLIDKSSKIATEIKKDKNYTLELRAYMFQSSCYNNNKTDIIKNLAVIEEIERTVGIKDTIDPYFTLAQMRGLVSATLIMDILTIPMKVFDNIGTTFSNPYGELSLDHFNQEEFLKHVFLPIQTPEFLIKQNINIDNWISYTLVFLILYLIARMLYMAKRIIDTGYDNKLYLLKDTVYKELLVPLFWLFVGIKLIVLGILLMANLILPLVVFSSLKIEKCNEQSITASCDHFKRSDDFCFRNNTRSCIVGMQVKSKYYERTRAFKHTNYNKNIQVTPNSFDIIGVINYTSNNLSLFLSNALSEIYMIVIHVILLAFVSLIIIDRQVQIFKSIADISLQCFYAYIDARDQESVYRLINTVKNEALALIIRSLTLSIGISLTVAGLASLNASNLIPALSTIFIGLFVMTRDRQLMIMLDISPREISAIDGGRYARQETMQKYMSRYSNTVNMVKKVNPYKIFNKRK